MKFLREIPANRLVQRDIAIYEQEGFVLIWKEDSLEVWVEVTPC